MAEVISSILSAKNDRCVETVKEDIPEGHVLTNEFRRIIWSVLYEKPKNAGTCACEGCNDSSFAHIRRTPRSLQLQHDDPSKQYWVDINTIKSERRRAGIMLAAEKIHPSNQLICKKHLEDLLDKSINSKTHKRKRTRTNRK